MNMAPPVVCSERAVAGNATNKALYMLDEPRRRRGLQQGMKSRASEHLYLIRKLPATGRNKRVL